MFLILPDHAFLVPNVAISIGKDKLFQKNLIVSTGSIGQRIKTTPIDSSDDELSADVFATTIRAHLPIVFLIASRKSRRHIKIPFLILPYRVVYVPDSAVSHSICSQ
jgi:hypothetical protein